MHRRICHVLACGNAKYNVGRSVSLFEHCCIRFLNASRKHPEWKKKGKKKMGSISCTYWWIFVISSYSALEKYILQRVLAAEVRGWRVLCSGSGSKLWWVGFCVFPSAQRLYRWCCSIQRFVDVEYIKVGGCGGGSCWGHERRLFCAGVFCGCGIGVVVAFVVVCCCIQLCRGIDGHNRRGDQLGK